MISARVECRNYRNSATYNSVVWLRLCVMALVIGVSIGWGQPAPDTILLPDSLGPLRPGYHLAFGSSTNNIYVASESSDIIVVDGNTFQRIGRISTGTPVGGALLVAQHNKLFCSYPAQGRIGVIDCATNSIVGSIEVGTRPTLLCYSSVSDKLYCGDTPDGTVSVIDCATNAVLKVIPVGESLTAMEYDPTTAKVYVATGSAVLAISCATDSVVATISAVKAAIGLCINQRRQKLYAVCPPHGGHDTVFVISTLTDSVAAEMSCSGRFTLPGLTCNDITDRLYGVTDFSGFLQIREFDCTRDTLVRSRGAGNYYSPQGLVCDTVRNRLYYLFADGDWCLLYGFDCATLDVFSETRVENYPAFLELDPIRRRILTAGGQREAVLSVFDCKRDSLDEIGVVPLRGWQKRLCRNSVAGKLYYRWGDGSGGVGVIDEQAKHVAAHVVLPQDYGDAEPAYSRTSNKVYFAASNGLGVLDGSGDSLLKVIEIGDGVSRLCWYPDGNKLYCWAGAGARLYLAVVDCYTDSVVREVDVYDLVDRFEYLDNDRLLCVRVHGLTLIDCRTDSVLVDTAIPGNMYSVAHTGDGKKVYIIHHYTYDRLDVLDASSLSLRTSIDWSYGGAGADPFLVCSDSTDKLYWFARDRHVSEPDSVLAIDTRSDSVVARLGAGFMQMQGCLDHSGRYIFNPNPENVFYPDPRHNSLIIYDTQSDSVAAVYEDLPTGPVTAIPNPEQGRIYVGCQDVILVYPDTPPGVEETPGSEVQATKSGPTVVRGVLVLNELGTRPELPERNSVMSRAVLLDVSGRKVLDLMPGANDVRALAPGVYFIREELQAARRKTQAVRKIVVTR